MTPNDAGLVRFRAKVRSALASAIEQECAQRGWDPDEGRRILLACGAWYLQAERIARDLEAGKLDAAGQKAVFSRALEMDSRLAFLLFETGEMKQTLKRWGLGAGAIRSDWELLPRLIQRRQEEIAALRAEVERLRAVQAEGEESASSTAAEAAEASDLPG